jgi:DNA-binding CsgD family transcriptional regulator
VITVAQSNAVPIIPLPRGRFAALTVGVDSTHVAGLTPRLRSLGASAVHRAATARGGQVPSPTGAHDLCVVEASGPQVREELRALRAIGWRKVVVVTTRSELVRHAIGSGARAAIVPPTQSAGAGSGIPLPRSRSGDEGVDAMSAREVQVLQRVAEGNTNRQIGEDLCLSALTVKSHLARIGRKLGTGDRAEMVAIGFRHGVVA